MVHRDTVGLSLQEDAADSIAAAGVQQQDGTIPTWEPSQSPPVFSTAELQTLEAYPEITQIAQVKHSRLRISLGTQGAVCQWLGGSTEPILRVRNAA